MQSTLDLRPMLPPLYSKGMLKGREWLAKPELSDR
jgi:hypothetical protein